MHRSSCDAVVVSETCRLAGTGPGASAPEDHVASVAHGCDREPAKCCWQRSSPQTARDGSRRPRETLRGPDDADIRLLWSARLGVVYGASGAQAGLAGDGCGARAYSVLRRPVSRRWSYMRMNFILLFYCARYVYVNIHQDRPETDKGEVGDSV